MLHHYCNGIGREIPMVRKILKWIGYLLLLLLGLIALFVAFNWTLVSNIVKIGQPGVTEVAKFQPALAVKGCPAGQFRADEAALPANAFAEMKAYSDKHKGVGLIVLVDGKVVGEAYRKGASATTRTASQSMHKTVLAMMVGAAIDDGIVKSVDDPVGNYLPEWRDDPRGKITLRQLLSMSSGLDNPSMAKMELAAMHMMMGDVSDAALGLDVAEKPGAFNYNNGNSQIAGTALSRALGKAKRGGYAQYLYEKLWCPLGNRNASLWPEFEGGEPRYYAFLDASVRDWAAVGELIRNRGKQGDKQLVSAAWIDEMTKPSSGNANYGLGIWRGSPWSQSRGYSRESQFKASHSAPYLADDVLFLDGFGGQRVYIVPSAKLVIARSGETSMTWDDAVLVNTALKALKR
jgi:CubicO group peptidase (beta-lactamase class C family)